MKPLHALKRREGDLERYTNQKGFRHIHIMCPKYLLGPTYGMPAVMGNKGSVILVLQYKAAVNRKKQQQRQMCYLMGVVVTIIYGLLGEPPERCEYNPHCLYCIFRTHIYHPKNPNPQKTHTQDYTEPIKQVTKTVKCCTFRTATYSPPAV